jgi:glycosyltransferase involved in cell wall biosynthesis
VVREIAEKIHTVLTDEKLRDSLLKRFERTKRFSAEKKANMTLEVFKEILNQ